MGVEADRWVEKYRRSYNLYELAALEVKKQIDDALSGFPQNIHLVEARAKDPDSVSEKILRRNYGRPSRQFDDLIGVRVITLFEHSVVEVVERLSLRFDVDSNRSSDKSGNLSPNEVGYRSNHLVMKARRTGLADSVKQILDTTYVEVQVRSVISHSWAEIEHSLRYKSGVGIPADLARRFDALAGTLELVDREFTSIARDTVEIIRRRTEDYNDERGHDDTLTALTLLSALPAKRPSMRRLGPDGLTLPIEEAHRFAVILSDCGVFSVSDLFSRIDSREVINTVSRYVESTDTSIEPEQASALVLIGAVVGNEAPSAFARVKAFTDPLLIAALKPD